MTIEELIEKGPEMMDAYVLKNLSVEKIFKNIFEEEILEWFSDDKLLERIPGEKLLEWLSIEKLEQHPAAMEKRQGK